jgi:hypothetical protein
MGKKTSIKFNGKAEKTQMISVQKSNFKKFSSLHIVFPGRNKKKVEEKSKFIIIVFLLQIFY